MMFPCLNLRHCSDEKYNTKLKHLGKIFTKIFSKENPNASGSTGLDQINDPFNRDVEGVDLIHLGQCPCTLLTVPSHLAPLVAGFA
jgi:hypothetical protein